MRTMDDTAHRLLIGVLGGMGPAATIDFMAKVVAATPAGRDQEHVPLLVHDVPQIPDRSLAIAAGSDAPLAPMLAGVRLLERSGVAAIAIACNTAHYWYGLLAGACAVPILHIADAVAAEVRAAGPQKERLALLATRGTRAAGLYQQRLGASLILPEEPEQRLVDATIAAVKAGRLPEARRLAGEIGGRMRAAGAGRLLLACTELPLAFAGGPQERFCLDATLVLARLCVAVSLGLQPLPEGALGLAAAGAA